MLWPQQKPAYKHYHPFLDTTIMFIYNERTNYNSSMSPLKLPAEAVEIVSESSSSGKAAP